VAAFADQINDGPVFFALLQMREVQISQFATGEARSPARRRESHDPAFP
jgi:hypothetical protein